MYKKIKEIPIFFWIIFLYLSKDGILNLIWNPFALIYFIPIIWIFFSLEYFDYLKPIILVFKYTFLRLIKKIKLQ